jgi:hypothetical protein
MNHEIDPLGTEETSTEILKSSEFDKTPLPFMFWPMRYKPTLHSYLRKQLQTAVMHF